MKHSKYILLLSILLFSLQAQAQEDWSNVNFTESCKTKSKVSKKIIKGMKSEPVFINKYVIGQATVMKGSESSATKAIHSEVSLNGIDQADYQQIIDDLYLEFVQN